MNGTEQTRAAAVRNALTGYLSSCAWFRANLATREHRPGGKNANYAESLDAVTKHIEALPDDDPTLARLVACGLDRCEFGHNGWEEDIYAMAIHCGSRDYPLDPRGAGEWFIQWAERVEADVRQHTCRPPRRARPRTRSGD